MRLLPYNTLDARVFLPWVVLSYRRHYRSRIVVVVHFVVYMVRYSFFKEGESQMVKAHRAGILDNITFSVLSVLKRSRLMLVDYRNTMTSTRE